MIRGNAKLSKVPTFGSVVTCRVLSINANQIRCAIHCVEHYVLKQPFRGLIRKEEVRSTEKDKVEIHKCFRAGDVILAKVIGIADNHSFLLSTAQNELGVVIAYNESGKNLLF